jgi:hypothetical protein
MSFSGLLPKGLRGIERREPEIQQGMRAGAADGVLEAVLGHGLCEGKFCRISTDRTHGCYRYGRSEVGARSSHARA